MPRSAEPANLLVTNPEQEALDKLAATDLINRAWLEEHTIKLLRAVHAPQTTLRLIDLRGTDIPGLPEKIVSKDFYDTTPLYCRTLGSFLLQREARAYERLRGLCGIPRASLCQRAPVLLIQYIPGVDLKDCDPSSLPVVALRQLERIIMQMHGRGVIHFDIGHDSVKDVWWGRDCNLLWSEAEKQLYIIDFAGSLIVPWPRWLKKKLAKHDRLAINKVKNRFFPDSETIASEDIPSPRAQWLYRKLGKY